MELPECSHERLEECDELVCIDCGLVMGPIFHSDYKMQTVHSFAPPPTASVAAAATTAAAAAAGPSSDEDPITDIVSNALARLFLDSDEMISEAVTVWKEMSRYRSADTSSGRRQLAFVLWKTLTDKGVLREKGDFERACGAERGSVAKIDKRVKCPTRAFIRPSKSVEALGSWLGLPYRHRRIIRRYMRTFESENTYLSPKPEVLAVCSILYVCDRLRRRILRKRAKNVSIPMPDYMKYITPSFLTELIDGEREDLKYCFNMLPTIEEQRAKEEEKMHRLRDTDPDSKKAAKVKDLEIPC